MARLRAVVRRIRPASSIRVVRRSVAAVVILCAAIAGIGCAGTARPTKPPAYKPPAFHPEQFPDIPLAPSFVPAPDEDHIAIVLAGGEVRRFAVTLTPRQGAPARDPALALADYASWLPAYGWSEVEPGRWRKGGEWLTVEAGRGEAGTTIRLRLRPAPAAAKP